MWQDAGSNKTLNDKNQHIEDVKLPIQKNNKSMMLFSLLKIIMVIKADIRQTKENHKNQTLGIPFRGKSTDITFH